MKVFDQKHVPLTAQMMSFPHERDLIFKDVLYDTILLKLYF